MTKAKRPKKAVAAPVPAVLDVPASEREALISAYKAGRISAWKRDPERGYRLTIAGRQDDYVDATKLMKYLEKLGATA